MTIQYGGDLVYGVHHAIETPVPTHVSARTSRLAILIYGKLVPKIRRLFEMREIDLIDHIAGVSQSLGGTIQTSSN
ncbi:MAG: hypothetical protein A2790_13420 [Phenylobacterium sp. RIFCSPHIGHO2_01_FULL_69_31]|nr:MAG: hypothetical protein A2790_13420 [Phenylobacterium sp. RIFCSPHIGHO2_01_FULL_69_31]